jgi:microcin C transport system permease protein
LIFLGCVFLFSMIAELISHHKPLLIYYQHQLYFPLFFDYPETTFGGFLYSNTDYKDPFIIAQLQKESNWVIYPLNSFSHDTLNYTHPAPAPAAPSIYHYLGTDDHGRDILARLIYAVRTSLIFAFALAIINTVIGVVMGAIQGYFGGKVDLYMQRFLEIWGAFPELYLWMILVSIFKPSLGLLLVLLSLSAWMGVSEYMRLEFLKHKQMDYIKSAKILGLSSLQIIWRHILPNVAVPIIVWFPFRVISGLLALTALDFLGLGMGTQTPSLGELLSQSKNNLEAWWILLPTLFLITSISLALTFIAEGLQYIFALKKAKS